MFDDDVPLTIALSAGFVALYDYDRAREISQRVACRFALTGDSNGLHIRLIDPVSVHPTAMATNVCGRVFVDATGPQYVANLRLPVTGVTPMDTVTWRERDD